MFIKLLIASMAMVSGNPQDVLKKISENRAEALRVARENKQPVDARALQAKARETAIEAVKDVDPKTVDRASAYAWARLFDIAGRSEDAIAAAERAEGADAFAAGLLIIDSEIALGRKTTLSGRIAKLPLTYIDDQIQLGSRIAYAYADHVKEASGTAEALRLLSDFAARPPVEPPKVAADRRFNAPRPQAADGAVAAARISGTSTTTPSPEEFQKRIEQSLESLRYELVKKQGELLSEDGKSEEGLALLRKFRDGLPAGSTILRSIDGDLKVKSLPGQPAPTFTFTETIGEFKGLESLKGKVVLLDFFAHWCGPCKAAFPDMRQTLADLKPKGLEIVGVTRYQGYYGTEAAQTRDMPKTTEFTKMEGFVKEQNLTWPVIFTDRAPFDAYGVTGIPHLVVIDRTGKVREIKIGYSKETYGKFRAGLEKLLAE